MHTPTKFLLMLSMLFLSVQSAQATAPSDTQLQAIGRMGELNGIALQCRFMDRMRRIKQILIQNLPKQRVLGDWFERKTNESFMGFMKDNGTCPGLTEFDQDLESARQQVEKAFSS